MMEEIINEWNTKLRKPLKFFTVWSTKKREIKSQTASLSWVKGVILLGNWVKYIREYEGAAKRNGWKSQEKVTCIFLHLRGKVW